MATFALEGNRDMHLSSFMLNSFCLFSLLATAEEHLKK